MITVKNLHFRYPTHPVLEGVHFIIPHGAKAGLVGPNGAGKTTLFGLLAGEEQPDAGSIEIHGSIGVVPQEVTYDPLLEQAPTARQYIDPSGSKRDDELYTLLNGLELAELNLDISPKSLSGGQKTKLALIRQLIAQPDNLLLDEPTNFLDVSGKHWVMNFLSTYPGTLLIISHDLPLLDQALNKVLYLNPLTRLIEEYTGNYSQFLKLRQEREQLFLRQRAAQAKHIEHMEKSLSKLKRQKSESGVRRRVQMRRRIERAKIALPELPPQLKTMRFKLPEPSNVGRVVIQAKGISKSYGNKKVLENVNFLL
jgi:ATP-binding cassette subfamily F protein 3